MQSLNIHTPVCVVGNPPVCFRRPRETVLFCRTKMVEVRLEAARRLHGQRAGAMCGIT